MSYAGKNDGIRVLTGDVEATGPGNSTPATVAAVGGKTAGEVSSTVDSVDGADSAATADTLVLRDGDANFAANATTLTDLAETTVSDPPAGSHKLINRNGGLVIRNSSGVESAIGGGSSPATTSSSGTIFKQFTGYNKIVGTHGDYATLASASIAAGDSILVISDTVEPFGIFLSGVADVQIDTLPGVKITTTNNTTPLTLNSCTRFRSKRLWIQSSGAAAGTALMIIQGSSADCHIADLTIELNNAGNTTATGLSLNGSGVTRNYINGQFIATAGTFTNELIASSIGNELHFLSMGGFKGTPGMAFTSQVLTLYRSGEVLLMNTTSGALNVFLPPARKGFMFTIVDTAGTFNTNNCTLVRFAGTESIQGVAANYVMNTARGFYSFICDGTNWYRCG